MFMWCVGLQNTLSHLTPHTHTHTDNVCAIVIELGGVAHIVKAMTTHKTSVDVLHPGCAAICNMAITGRCSGSDGVSVEGEAGVRERIWYWLAHKTLDLSTCSCVPAGTWGRSSA